MPGLSLVRFTDAREKKKSSREGVREGKRKGEKGNLIKDAHRRTKK